MKPTLNWIKYAYTECNKKYFIGRLPNPKFSLKCDADKLGFYQPNAEYNKITRKIVKINGPGVLSINGSYSRTERDLTNTLLHEMIHVYIYNVLRINPRNPHGQDFQRVAYRINLHGWDISEKNELVTLNGGQSYYLNIIMNPNGTNYKVWLFRSDVEVTTNSQYYKTAKRLKTLGATELWTYSTTNPSVQKLPTDPNSLTGVGSMDYNSIWNVLSKAIGDRINKSEIIFDTSYKL